MKLSIRTKLFFSHFVAIMLVSGSIGSYFYQNAIDSLLSSLQSRLQYSAALLSYSFEPQKLDLIQNEQDTASPIYVEMVLQLRQAAFTNPDIAFLYVMKKNGNEISFVLDSDEEEPALPGEIYQENLPSLLRGFDAPSADDAIVKDKWGSFMSGYAPVAGSQGKYLIGIDMRADEVERKLNRLRTTGYVSLLFSILLAFLFSHYWSRHLVKRIRQLHQRCLDVGQAEGGAPEGNGDEIDDLSKTFNVMLDRVQESQAELEARVALRTTELQLANSKLQSEMEERERIALLLEQTARTDYLTKLLNRRAMVDALQQELARQDRNSLPFSVVLVDIDHFKQINDTYGHDVGDEVLKRISTSMGDVVREQDIVSRWGGEEFLILLPNTGESDASEQAERVRKHINALRINTGNTEIGVTASFGVSQCAPGEHLERVLKNADVALYEAKSAGRNRVVQASTM